MNRRRFITLALGSAALAGFAPHLPPRNLKRFEEKSFALGSEISLIAYHEDEARARRAVAAAFKALDEIEDVLSLYRPDSQLCRLNRERIIRQPHPDLVAVLRNAVEWARLTDGAFDPTVQPLWKLQASGNPFDVAGLEAARSLVDWTRVHVSAEKIRLGPGQEITLNGIAQGFAADRVREIFLAYGICHGLANTGEFCALGDKPDGKPWQIGVQHPRVQDAYVTLASVTDRFLSTSGDYETKFTDDFSNHHIFDPSTGRSPTELSSVTVLAPTGMEADALSTAIFVLGSTRGFELAATRTNVDVLLVTKAGEVLATSSFPKHA
ncbi:MAG TPA: FAD:protein FMN transferase [Candidatus Saccharimonadales bacterium]|nr:FAD:protein FMN transferase [Candidatus Saccharimonadales bacterium]